MRWQTGQGFQRRVDDLQFQFDLQAGGSGIVEPFVGAAIGVAAKPAEGFEAGQTAVRKAIDRLK